MVGAGCLQVELGQAEFFETFGLASLEILRQEFRRFLVKRADYSKQYSILALEFL